jgi:hypothetical protein
LLNFAVDEFGGNLNVVLELGFAVVGIILIESELPRAVASDCQDSIGCSDEDVLFSCAELLDWLVWEGDLLSIGCEGVVRPNVELWGEHSILF